MTPAKGHKDTRGTVTRLSLGRPAIVERVFEAWLMALGYNEGMTELSPGITVDPSILSGKPVVKGTRVPVDLILSRLGHGMKEPEIQSEYGVSHEDILRVLSYAADALSKEHVRAVS